MKALNGSRWYTSRISEKGPKKIYLLDADRKTLPAVGGGIIEERKRTDLPTVCQFPKVCRALKDQRNRPFSARLKKERGRAQRNRADSGSGTAGRLLAHGRLRFSE